ncbi:NAD-dependent epimerase/dehydratase family protein [Deinococcus sp. KNUC1210]|uniref:NAD-dependent epimerase/dehydratase family protein n=1 Tax=Deinococcus sp. KNUC1210 TaxID=2917691 RepID=UPI001EF0E4A9|nr:NAD-dependent epimerase/dehydratase family protein [Deinococcus sp. KNUC1210]ULH14928.1 NAD-dependent epimerase/dehydratase family protein [Deinococcus sp. KNUC1210]
MNLLVLGGTRFVGKSIVLAALERGHSVTVFTRGQTPDDLPAAVTRLHGDRSEGLDALGAATWGACIDVNGYLPRFVRHSAEVLRGRVERYLFISTVSVYAPGERETTPETAPLIELDDPATEDIAAHYGGLKVLCERAVSEVYGERATHVRPHIVAGPEDYTRRFTYWPEALAKGEPVLAPGDGSDPVQYIDARDLGMFVVHLLETGQGGIYNAAAPFSSWREFLAQIAAGVGSAAELHWTPATELEARGLGWNELPLYVPRAADDQVLMRTDTAAAVAAGLRCRPLEETARETLAWSVQQPAEARPRAVPLDSGQP